MRALRLNQRRDLTGLLLGIRRGAIVLILLLGYLYFKIAGEAYALVSIGLISFAAVAQFAPAALGGIFWKGGTRRGALAGLAAGFAVWFYTLLLPAFARSEWLPIGFLEHGPFGIELLKPVALFGVAGLDQITHAMIWSMVANIGAYVGVSLAYAPSAEEHRQATLFVDVFKRPAGARFRRGTASDADLFNLLARFIGLRAAGEAFAEHARRGDTDLVHFVENQLAGVIGAASAHIMLASVVKEEVLTLDEVRTVLDEASQIVVYSHRLEQKSQELERATQELREANERLTELDRMKDEFVSTVLYELRTPLTSIRSFTEILHDNPQLPAAERQRFLGIVIKETGRLSRLIGQVLDVSRLESGRVEWHESLFDMREVIEDTAASTSQLFRERDVRLECNLPGRVPKVRADLDRIVQVVVNLLSNAVKFIEPGRGRVQIELVEAGGFLRVDVRDNGPGINPEHQEMIFERFRQAGDPLTGKPQGTGLGLYISRRIIEHSGGRLWVNSRPGAGACFSFTLPLVAEASMGRAA
jgi:signal transduction histidine kinase